MAEKDAKSEGGSKQGSARAVPMPASIAEISKESVQELGAKLDKFGNSLSESERVTLMAALALAGRGFQTFPGAVACERGLRVGIGESAISVEKLAGTAMPSLSQALADTFCPGSASRFSIEGLEVEKPMFGAKSVAAYGAKSVAAACRTPGAISTKSVAAACRTPGAISTKSVAAACRTPGAISTKSVAAACRTPGAISTKSVADACRTPGAVGTKSVAAACRTPGAVGTKSVAAACRMPGYSWF